MTRTLYPDDRMVLGVPRVAGRPVVSRAGQTVEVFQDADLLQPADLEDVQSIPISHVLVLDQFSRFPEFLGPDNYEGPLYTSLGSRLYPVSGKVGPPGPQGDPGAAGEGDLADSSYYAFPATTWRRDHPELGFIPSGIIVHPNGSEPMSNGFEIVQNDELVTIVRFDVPAAGWLHLS